MTDANHGPTNDPKLHRPSPLAESPAIPIATVTFLAAMGAAGAVFGLGDLVGMGVAVLIAAGGAAVAAMAAGKTVAPSDKKATALLEAAMADDAPAQPPSRFRGEPWFSLYARVAGYVEAQKAATLAVDEADRLRAELHKITGKHGHPVTTGTHDAEGDSHAAAEAPTTALDPSIVFAPTSFEAPAPFEPTPRHAGNELVGAESAPSQEAGVSEAEVAEQVRAAIAGALEPAGRDLGAIERALEPILQSLRAAESKSATSPNDHPAKMLDALVRTAADGIEDMAAGLMRASELAGVAERVTNRATLLALNAALEATRSGSEAFASIAEETRRLAEYAREATDTISRLAGEIEIKVGETIASIQTTSEDAKAAVESMRTGGAPATRVVDPAALEKLELVLQRVRELRERMSGGGESRGADVTRAAFAETHEPADAPAVAVAADTQAAPDAEPVPSYVTLDASADAEPAEAESGAPAGTDTGSADTGAAGAADASPGAAGAGDEADKSSVIPPIVPRVVEKIPDWLEGLEPRDRH